MIVKPRQVPLKIEILEALLRRLPNNHPKIPAIQTELTNRKSGYKGELESDYHLSLLPEKDYYILHDIRLPHNDTFFQIDSIIIAPGFILILNVKNFYGTIHLMSDQMIREYEGKEQGFPNPLIQAKRHVYLFQNWMTLHKLPPVPLEFLVVFSNPATIIKNPANNPEIHQNVCHAESLLLNLPLLKNKYDKKPLTGKTIKKFKESLLFHDMPQTPSYPAFGVLPGELKTGIQCPKCCSFGMFRLSGKWYCSRCKASSKDAHSQAIKDYFFLFQPTITNQELCDYLQLSSQKLASRLLREMNLNSTGNTKKKIYFPFFQ